MEKITEKQYLKALSICNDYREQEMNKIMIIDNEINKIKDIQSKVKEFDSKKHWIKVRKGDSIKIIKPKISGRSILKSGEVLKVTAVNKRISDSYVKLWIKVWAKINTRKYIFTFKWYEDDPLEQNDFYQDCIFEII